MLKDLFILNGKISPKFNSLNNYYSVTVDNSVTSLKIKYTCDNCDVQILNNDILLEGENEVSILVSTDKNETKYTFYVNRLESKTVFKEQTLEPIKDESPQKVEGYNSLYLIICCAVIILFLFKILFIKKRR